jgi:hypothetical protein
MKCKKAPSNGHNLHFSWLGNGAPAGVGMEPRDCPALPRPASMAAGSAESIATVNAWQNVPQPTRAESGNPAARWRLASPGRGWM